MKGENKMRITMPIALALPFLGWGGTLAQPQPQCPSGNSSNIIQSCTDGNGTAHNYTVCVSPVPPELELCADFFKNDLNVAQCPLETIDQLMGLGNFAIPGLNFEAVCSSLLFLPKFGPTPRPTPRPTPSPTPRPTPSPTSSPTSRPTSSPTSFGTSEAWNYAGLGALLVLSLGCIGFCGKKALGALDKRNEDSDSDSDVTGSGDNDRSEDNENQHSTLHVFPDELNERSDVDNNDQDTFDSEDSEDSDDGKPVDIKKYDNKNR